MSTKSTASGFVSSQKYVASGFVVLFILIFLITVFYSEPELHREEERLVQQLGVLHMREQYLKMGFQELKAETLMFVNRVSQAVSVLSSNSVNLGNPKMLDSIVNSLSSFATNENLKAPSVYNFLPHLLLNFSSLKPAYKWSKSRTGVSTVLGVPTVNRPAKSYLLATLDDLINKMSPKERNDSLIVIFIAEVNETYVQKVVQNIKSSFQKEMDAGLIDIISPPSSYYPDFTKLPTTLADPMERVRWRSKQSLDFAFLMMYSYQRGMFYVQLEDDIFAKPNYLTTMKNVALKKIAKKQPWLVLDFCQLGFIGKMFRCVDLPWIISFFLMFFNDKPVDWLLDGFIQTKVCNLEKDEKDCRHQKNRMWVHINPSLFQHIGTESSLKGKIQNLKDTHFGKVSLFQAYKNPRAKVFSSIEHYKGHSIMRAYRGQTFFWGLTPKNGDWIAFHFNEPIKIKSFKFKTGNAETPADKLVNASVLVAPLNDVAWPSSLILMLSTDNTAADTPYLVVGTFNNLGTAEGQVDNSVGLVKELCILVQYECKNWVVLSEIQIVQDENRR